MAIVKKNGKSDKIIVFKYKAKVRYRRKNGHRQLFTSLGIDSILPPGVEDVQREKPAKKATPKKIETEKPVAEEATKKTAEAAKPETKASSKKTAEAIKPLAKAPAKKTATTAKPVAKKAPAKKTEEKPDGA
jgi:large subunit ribosomal protein L21